jgi:hypothetical protein
MAFKIIPDSVRECFSYDPETGVISRVKPVSGGKVGPCGSIDSSGYIRIPHKSRTILAHRLAWFLGTGQQPQEIDHINRDRSDNRLCNLRSVNRSTNQLNKNVRGISWISTEQRWEAKFKRRTVYKGRNIMLAHFHRYMAVTATHSPALPRPSE